MAVMALAVVVVGPGEDDNNTSASGNAIATAFIADMTIQHQAAIEMAELAKEKTNHAEIRTLANDQP
jgi:uncharacterized protein (DUF305 family)